MRALPVRREHRMDVETGVGCRLRELEAAGPPLGRVGQQRERVEVHRPARRPGQREHQLAVGIVVAVQERARNELDRAAAHLPQHARQGDELFRTRVIARYAAPVVGDVQLELARREADRALVERLAHQHAHLRDLTLGRGSLRRIVAHHVAAHGAVPDVLHPR